MLTDDADLAVSDITFQPNVFVPRVDFCPFDALFRWYLSILPLWHGKIATARSIREPFALLYRPVFPQHSTEAQSEVVKYFQLRTVDPFLTHSSVSAILLVLFIQGQLIEGTAYFGPQSLAWRSTSQAHIHLAADLLCHLSIMP
jgi:hypothetical protein